MVKTIKRIVSYICIIAMIGCMWGCGSGSGNETEDTDKLDNESITSSTVDKVVDNGELNDDTSGSQSSGDNSSVKDETSSIDDATTEETTTTENATNKPSDKEDTTEGPTVVPDNSTDENVALSGTPYGVHGKLSVSGTQLVDKNGQAYQLKGVSTHGISWFPQYVSYDTFKYLREEWGANVVRIAMYTAEYNGYCSGGNKEELKALVKKGVDAATELGLYVVVDWHILSDSNPWTNKDEAVKFFQEMSSYYKNQDNIIYEICNEPNGGTSWSDIKSYANEIIPVIRANDPDAIIVVGTPTWSQDVDAASWDKITGYDNIMYTLHYYAATHKQWLRDKAQTAINNGCALFVTEFSICDASGNGALDKAEANLWLEFLNKNGISFIGWNLANKNESSSLFLSSCNKIYDFADGDLSDWAKWLRDAIGE